MYITTVYLDELKINVPFALFLNFLLYVLLAMNIYWFSVSCIHKTPRVHQVAHPFSSSRSCSQFILNLLYKVVTGQVLEDNRDYSDEQKQGIKSASQSQHDM